MLGTIPGAQRISQHCIKLNRNGQTRSVLKLLFQIYIAWHMYIEFIDYGKRSIEPAVFLSEVAPVIL